MLIKEFRAAFDVYYNNITSNQAPNLSEFEKCLFLTKAEKEVVKNYFSANSRGNTLGQGFDDSAKRQADFSVLMKTSYCTEVLLEEDPLYPYYTYKYTCSYQGSTEEEIVVTNSVIHTFSLATSPEEIYLAEGNYSIGTSQTHQGKILVIADSVPIAEIKGFPCQTPGNLTVAKEKVLIGGRIDDRSVIYEFPKDTFIIINESVKTIDGKYLQVIPISYDEYTRLMSKPFKRPLKNQVWRIINSGKVFSDTDEEKGKATKYVELITNGIDVVKEYCVRYIRVPAPIITEDLGELSIDGCSSQSEACEVDPILHDDIVQRAVELAKISWGSTIQDNTQLVMATGQRVE